MPASAVTPEYPDSPTGPANPKPPMMASLIRIAVALSALAIFAGLLWYAYNEGIREGSERVAPLIRAEAGKIKSRPKEPGGLRVPHRDKRVYRRLTPGGRTKKGVERLIPRPGRVDIVPRAAPKPDRRIKGGAARGIATVIGPKRGDVSKRRVKRIAKRKEPPRYVPDPLGIRVQIAAFPTPQAAARRWERLMGRHKDLIGKLDWFVEKVNRGRARGPLYRLQLGPLKDRRSADELCAKLGKRKVSCLFVKG